MKHYSLDTIEEWKNSVRAGSQLLLSGTVYTARDAAHKRLLEAIKNGEPLPFPIKNAAIYYAGPTPKQGTGVIGSVGPTTSYRMDAYMQALTELGLTVTIGKGDRSPGVKELLKQHKTLYLCALGGCGALYAQCVTSNKVIAYPDLGCEAIRKLTVENFPVIVGIDSFGNSAFQNP